MLNIRKMRPEDETRIYEMMRVFYDSPAVIHKSSDKMLRDDIKACLSDSPFLEGFVFEDGEKIAGYMMTAPSFTTEFGGPCIWLEDLYLEPEYRNQNLSQQIFKFFETQYPGAVRFKLEVEAENERAIAAYKKNGYAISPYFEMTKEV